MRKITATGCVLSRQMHKIAFLTGAVAHTPLEELAGLRCPICKQRQRKYS